MRLAGSVAMLLVGSALLCAAAFARLEDPARDGGTLDIDRLSDPTSVDPALNNGDLWDIEAATCLKLVNYPDRGNAGYRLVPEAAAGLPTVSKDGRTFTFTVSPARFHFNTGEPVTAATFALVLNRDLAPTLASQAASYLHDVVGADAVLAGKADAAAGIRVNGDQLSMRLKKVEPDFVARLALPLFCALPIGTSAEPGGVEAPVPSAGPYFIASWSPGRLLVVERNPHYTGTRPHRVERMVVHIGVPLSAQLLRMEKGETDVGSFPPSAVDRLRNTFGVNRGRLFVRPFPQLWFLYLNTSRLLFRDVRLRQAVNLALDRPFLARQLGPVGGEPTDQILTPGFPGFRDWHIYPVRGPEYARARTLAAAHRGATVRLWIDTQQLNAPIALIVKRDLERIGLRVTISRFSTPVLFERAGKRGAPYDVILGGWYPGYGDPYDALNSFLDGTLIGPAHNVNLSYFDSPRWNKRMGRVSRLSGAARLRAYALLDRDLMAEAAPIAPWAHGNYVFFVSPRVGCVVFQPVFGPDLAAMCLKS